MNPSPKSIVVLPWDFSEFSQRSLEFALNEFPPELIRVICVLDFTNPYAPDFTPPYLAAEKALANCRANFEKEVKPEQYPGLQFLCEDGDPADEINRFASEFDASLIIMSTHGRTGLKRLFMGSTTEKVLRTATCPVLVLPAHNTTNETKQTQLANLS